MNSKNYYYGGDGQSDNDPVVVAYPVNPTAPPAMSNIIADTGLQPSVLRFQNEGTILLIVFRLNDVSL
jgi:hypothetical protein